MNLSLVSQKPSAATTLGVLAALRAASGDGHYFTEITVAQPDRWQPSKEEAAILLLEDLAIVPLLAIVAFMAPAPAEAEVSRWVTVGVAVAAVATAWTVLSGGRSAQR